MTSVLLVFVLLTSSLSAQSLPPAPSETSTPEPQATEQAPLKSPPILPRDQFFSKGFVQQLLKDQRSIWAEMDTFGMAETRFHRGIRWRPRRSPKSFPTNIPTSLSSKSACTAWRPPLASRA